jgi:hypothetical protein
MKLKRAKIEDTDMKVLLEELRDNGQIITGSVEPGIDRKHEVLLQMTLMGVAKRKIENGLHANVFLPTELGNKLLSQDETFAMIYDIDRGTIQISATIDKGLHQQVKDEAFRDGRSFSETVGTLLGNAIKERERQRVKNARKKSNS